MAPLHNPTLKLLLLDYLVPYVMRKTRALSLWAVCLYEPLVPLVILAPFIGHALHREGGSWSGTVHGDRGRAELSSYISTPSM